MSQETPELLHVKPVPRPARWISAGVVGVVFAGIIYSLVTTKTYRWDLVWKYLFDPRVLGGVGWTLFLTVAAMTLGIIMAITMAIMRQSENPVMRWVSWVYIWFFRGTPVYTQLVFWGLIPTIYPTLILGIPFGPELLEVKSSVVFTGLVCAILGLGLNEGAYLAEIVRSGLNSVDKGQWEAATALGMKRGKIMQRIIIPQAMRVIVPPTGNETISMLKTTSLVLAVPFTLELTFITNAIGNKSFQPVPLLLVAAIWYLFVTSILMIGQNYLEAYYGRGFEIIGRPDQKRRAAAKAASLAATTKADPFIDTTP